MPTILAVYGSPRRKGNSALLLAKAVEGSQDAGAVVESLYLRDLKMSPCLEIYECLNTGRCAVQDDFQDVYDKLATCDGLMLASPVFFYAVSAHTKILMDRCQSFWAKKYKVEKRPFGLSTPARKGLFVSVGASAGKKLFDGALLSVRYFFDALDMDLWKCLLYRSLDSEGDVLKHPTYLTEAYEAGREFCEAIRRSEA
ncbi:MAG: flavodoxin family protein [Pseudomonadota bacterium]